MIVRKSIGEVNLNYTDKLEVFLKGVDDYVSLQNLAPTKFNAEFAIPETLSYEQISKLTQHECFDFAFQLFQYADHVSVEKGKLETVVRWCESNLSTIVAHEIQDMAGEYMKHEVKVGTVLRNHDLAKKINEWKLTAESRLDRIKHREFNIRRKADILIEKGKRK